jgi:uncharacterized protein
MKLVRNSLVALLLSASSFAVGCAAEPTDDENAVDGTEDELRSGKAEIETFVGADNQFYFQLKGANGEKLLASEGYRSKEALNTGIASVKLNGSRRANYEVREAVNGQSYVVLKAQNNEIIATSETYVSKSNAERARDRMGRLLTNIKISEAPRTSRMELFKSLNDGQFYWHYRARNGEILLQSEGYVSRQGAENGIEAAKAAAVSMTVEFATARDGRVYFVLKARNGETVAVSETYSSRAGAVRAAETVRTNIIEDLDVFVCPLPPAPSCGSDAACEDFACVTDLRDGLSKRVSGLLGVDATCTTMGAPTRIAYSADHYFSANLRCRLASEPSAEAAAAFPAKMTELGHQPFRIATENGRKVVLGFSTSQLCAKF